MKLTIRLLVAAAVGAVVTLSTGVVAAGGHAKCLTQCNAVFQNDIAVCYQTSNPYGNPDTSKACCDAASVKLGGCNMMCMMVPDASVEVAAVAPADPCREACAAKNMAAMATCRQSYNEITDPTGARQCGLQVTDDFMHCMYSECSSLEAAAAAPSAVAVGASQCQAACDAEYRELSASCKNDWQGTFSSPIFCYNAATQQNQYCKRDCGARVEVEGCRGPACARLRTRIAGAQQ